MSRESDALIDAMGLPHDIPNRSEIGERVYNDAFKMMSDAFARGTRKCGECTLCCKLLPVQDMTPEKPWGKRCPHQSHAKGCRIYDRRPLSCFVYSCRWLTGNGTERLSRPDRSHYVLDTAPDVVKVYNDVPIQVDVVWVDPRFPDAWRDPALLEFCNTRGKDNVAVLVRRNREDGFVIFPPSMTGKPDFVTIDGNCSGEKSSAVAALTALADFGVSIK